MVISDPTGEIDLEFKLGAKGSGARVRMGFIDPETDTPILDSAKMLTMYRGQIDQGELFTDRDKKYIQLTCASPMVDLDTTYLQVTSKEGMDQLNEADTSYDNIYQGVKEARFAWGKIT
jgi:hypothetical protein